LPINKAFDNQTFSQMIFAADEQTATTTTYAVAPWTKGPFVGVDPPGKIIKYRIFDFYQLKGNKIWYSIHILFFKYSMNSYQVQLDAFGYSAYDV